MSSSLLKKVSTTLSRAFNGDSQVYADLGSYLKTKTTLASRKVKHQVSNKSASISSKIAVSHKDRLFYSVELLIDPEFYGEQIGETFPSRKKALQHYRSHWKSNKADPHPLFSTLKFLEAVEGQIAFSPIDTYFTDPTYFSYPVSELFDSEFYRTSYHWTANSNPLVHFLSSGFTERHRPTVFFDSDFYLNSNSNKLGDEKNAYLHFLKYGWKRGLRPHPLIDLEFMAETLSPGKGLENLSKNPFSAFMQGEALNPSPWFNASYYIMGLKDVARDTYGENEVTHKKAFELFLDPTTPLADPSPRFSEAFYKSHYPDIGSMNGLYHYIRHGQFEMRRMNSSMPAAYNQDFLSTVDIDPEVNAPHQNIKTAMIVDTPRLKDPVNAAIIDLVKRRSDFVPDIVYVFRGFVRGGAEKYGAKIVNAISSSSPETKILVLAYDTDEDKTENWIEPRNNVHFIKAGPLQLNLSHDQRTTVLGRFLIWNDPKLILVNNSHAGWEVLGRYGKALSNRARLCATLFCYDFDEYGQKVGYARNYVRSTVRHIDTFITDNSSFGPQLVKDFSLGKSALKKFKTLFQFNETHYLDFEKNGVERKARVLWAARMSRQKNVSLLRRIAEAMPRIEFLVWSIGKWDADIAGGSIPGNVIFTEEQTTFAEIATRDVDAFLLTSHWEGLPTTVIEATVAGLPVIAADVGGVSDLIDNKRGWLVEDDNAKDFIEALDDCLLNSDKAELRVKAAQIHAQNQNSIDAYLNRLDSLKLLSPKRQIKADPHAGQSRRQEPSRTHIANDASKIRLARTTLDATIVVNGHREGAFILPTLISSRRALEHLNANDGKGEILILLDNPDHETRSICEDFALDTDIRILEIDVRDLGISRNSAVRSAKGKYVAFMDGDDMMSENWVTQGVRSLEEFGSNVVLHPASNYIFGNGDTYIYLHLDMDNPEFDLTALIAENYWTAISMAPRSLYLNFPYEANHIKQGLAYEDWSWHCYTIANGVTHKIAPNTSHYIRRKREGSLLAQTTSSHALPRLYHLRDYPNVIETSA